MATYSRERTRINAATIDRVNRMLKAGTVPGAGHDIADEITPGLVLRVNRTYAVWYLKTRTRTIRISDMPNLSPQQARTAVVKTREELDRGEDPADSLYLYALAASGEEEDPEQIAWGAPPPDRKKLRRQNGPWIVKDLIDEFVAWKTPRLRPGYGSKWSRYLELPEFARFAHLRVQDLHIEILETLRDSLLRTHPTSTAWRATQQFKEGLSWAWRHQARRSGLGATEYEWWQRLTLEYMSGVREHTPTIEELARTLALVDALGLARGNAASPGTLPALWAVVITGQRTGQLVATRADYVVSDDEREGWHIIAWPRPSMKASRGKSTLPHALPIPPEGWALIDSAMSEEFIFPSRGPGNAVSSITKSALNQLFLRLAGKRGGNDLFAAHGIRPWTPHDVRRSLTSFLSDRRLGGAASAILDHKDKFAPEPERTADVTRLIYDRAQRLPLKAEGMELWCKEVLTAYERERARLEGPRS